MNEVTQSMKHLAKLVPARDVFWVVLVVKPGEVDAGNLNQDEQQRVEQLGFQFFAQFHNASPSK
jgi:hypothetical protein